MVGFDTRDIEGQWYEARVSDPYATYWYRREPKSWGYSLNSPGWCGAWESLDWFDALDRPCRRVKEFLVARVGFSKLVWEPKSVFRKC